MLDIPLIFAWQGTGSPQNLDTQISECETLDCARGMLHVFAEQNPSFLRNAGEMRKVGEHLFWLALRSIPTRERHGKTDNRNTCRSYAALMSGYMNAAMDFELADKSARSKSLCYYLRGKPLKATTDTIELLEELYGKHWEVKK